MHRLLFRRIRDLIAEGVLTPGARLPPSRVLATALGLSRNTITAAFDQLAADGWVEPRRGSGAYVADAPPIPGVLAGRAVRRLPAPDSEAAPFDPDVLALDLFPIQVWNRLQSRRWRRMPRSALSETAPLGWRGLREAFASHLAISRGLKCEAHQVIVTTNVRAGMDLVIRALGLAGSRAIVEDPGFFGFEPTLAANRVTPTPCRVDEAGLDVDAALAAAPDAKFVIVTPACQFPTGVVMCETRAKALAAWAASGGGYIFEDDHDSESLDRPRSPVTNLARDRSFYFKSFSRLLFPNLRLSCIVAPEGLAEAFARAARATDAYGNVPNQMVMADFINDGFLDDHLRRLRDAWAERRAALMEVAPDLAPALTIDPRQCGLQVVGRLHGLTEAEAVARARLAGVELTPMGLFATAPRPHHEVLLGVSGFPPDRLRRAARDLAGVLGDEKT